ncbi:MAG: S-layer homology domain-containing protein, partial [Armatimonadota bacterium]|nr:S-layer homology domain-containing protein [Armatimonadota bacterium]
MRRLGVVLWVTGTALSWAWAQSGPPDLAGSWAASRIQVLLERRVVDTDPDGLFRPESTLTRARFVRWLVTARGLPAVRPDRPSYPDVQVSSPEAAFVEAAARYGLLPEESRFRPHEPLRRAEAVDWVVR